MKGAPAIYRPKKPKIYFAVQEGALIPADRCAEEDLRQKNFRDGDIVGAILSKLRTKGLNRLVHYLGVLCVQNLEDFKYATAHEAIKRLQIEGNIACFNIKVRLPGAGWMTYRVPKSISFDSMDEAEFRQCAAFISAYICATYWHGMEPYQIETMARAMV